MFRPAHLLVSLGIGLAPVALPAVSLDGLASESPFMPRREEGAAVPAVTEGASVEFRGMISTKDGVLFGLFDRTKNLGAWVRENDPGADFKVLSYDANQDVVPVEYQGQRFTLPLSMAKIAKAAPAGGPVPPGPDGGRQVDQRVNVAPSPDDQRRLESVAAEVRRRRALRQAAASGGATTATGSGQQR